MSSRILTSCISNISTFMNNHESILNNAENGTVSIIINNSPAFYVVSTQRLTQLLEIEALLARSVDNMTLNEQFYEKEKYNLDIPKKKFSMYLGWYPDRNFRRMAALWGILLKYPVTASELSKFINYWKEEKKTFYHIQWQKKLARSIQISRVNTFKFFKKNVNVISELNNQIPIGFRG